LEQQAKQTEQNLQKENNTLKELTGAVQKAEKALQDATQKVQTQESKIHNIEQQKTKTDQDLNHRKSQMGLHEAELRKLGTDLQNELKKK